MLRALSTVIFVALVATGAAGSRDRAGGTPAPAVPAQPTFFISGHGWGHGLGMSQYGAYGYALHGWKYDKILAHYYTGTTLGQAPVKRVRVLLVNTAKTVTIASKLPFRAVGADGAKVTLDAGSYRVGAAFKAKDSTDPTAKPQALTYPIDFRPGATAVTLNGRAYRGSLRVLDLGAKVRVVNVVDLDLYLRGVVPSEMPKDWAPEALKAQAVAARSYALSHLHSGGGFDLYPDTRDQVYLGIPHEAPATTAAVNATAGQVVLYKGKVASTYFFSTSGGRTASIQDLYPGSPPVPYLVSVVDKYDSISPYHDWGPFQFSPARLARRFKVPGRLLDVRTTASASGRVRSLVATGSGGDVTVDGSKVRTLLGLRSTWFSVGVLALGAPPQPVAYGTAMKLAGTARGVSSVELQARGDSGGWETVATLTPKGGAVAPKIRPTATSRYRLTADDISSAPVAVPVTRRIVLHVPPDQTGFWGAVRPGAGVLVRVQRQAGPAWRTIAAARTNAAGRFTVARSVTPGTYRARVAAGAGFVTGLSKLLVVQ
jgi:stage II sporulation protein D